MLKMVGCKSIPPGGACCEDGHSLLEGAVALVLLVTVLVPLTLFVMDRRPAIQNEQFAEAISYGRNSMELFLATGGRFSPENEALIAKIDTIRWNELAAVQVTVRARSRDSALVTFRAVIPTTQ